MQYAVYLPNFGPFGDARMLADLAADAERAGWNGFFIWDHIAAWGGAPMVDAWVALAAIALSTRRMRIGALVTPLPRRRPHKVARESVSIDRLSGGRLIFGAGIGNGDEEWVRLGEESDLRRRGQMLDEGLQVLDGLWSGCPFSFHGQHYRVEDTVFLPRPVQEPRIPVWIAGFWPHKAPLRRAVHWDGIFPVFESEGEAELHQIQEFVEFFKPLIAGRTGPYDLVYAGCPTPGNEPDRAAEIVSRYAAYGFTWWLEHINPFVFGGAQADSWPLGAMRERILQGPPRIR